jgi:tetratricopeptide (TPR) repeat protein
MLKRKLIVAGLAAAGVAGALGFDEYQALRREQSSWLMTTIGAPFCAPDRAGPQYKTFFRLALAQAESSSPPRKTEVGPFSRAIPDAESLAKADANPVLMDNLGSMHYAVTTSVPEAQTFFDQGLRLTYAFNHAEAVRAFRKARTLDPACAMCWWGEALVLGPNINAPMDAASVAAAVEAASRAKAAASGATPKERALVEAVAARYAPDAATDRSGLDRAYAAAMEKVAAAYPDDPQIAVLYAESLMDLQPWDYWEGGSKPKGRAADIVTQLEKVLRTTPDHPGAIHYYIHVVEASTDPKRALPHARRLGDLVPGAGHLVHMPFHTYFRVGLFKEAVEANKKAVAADEAFIARSTPVGLYPMAYYPHNVHSLLVSAQMAGDGTTVIDAAGKLEEIVSEAAARNIPWVQPIKAAPYFAHAQFSDSNTIMQLPDPGDAFPYVQAMWRYARAVGLAQRGDAQAARAEVAEIEKLGKANDFADLAAGGVPAKDVLRLAQSVANGRIAQAERDTVSAVKHFEAAVAQEDKLAYSEPPFWYYPTRQSLGAAYAAAGDLDKAEDTLRTILAKTPNNGWALYGLMKVYEQRGDQADAGAARKLLDNAWMGDKAALDLARL